MVSRRWTFFSVGSTSASIPHGGQNKRMCCGREFSRQRWAGAGRAYVRRAGLLYSWSLRNLLLIAPVVAFMLHPMAGPVAVYQYTAVPRKA